MYVGPLPHFLLLASFRQAHFKTPFTTPLPWRSGNVYEQGVCRESAVVPNLLPRCADGGCDVLPPPYAAQPLRYAELHQPTYLDDIGGRGFIFRNHPVMGRVIDFGSGVQIPVRAARGPGLMLLLDGSLVS